ncbi:anti-sigma factor [Nocardia amikacinitolerans]|uniref:anti-sigma factor n=1 Tax=Nocardia amikacinitolerans TaxID=756689 RepID=UPI0020A2B921|nr:anti-sigma factor [Nocardia amikacinitolerans]MCP2274584.1 Anti-sigma-K factor RskA [Nocardia amikacinitolerans]MCP2297069.1 Anti-sigma-K factor RskA [Nocardia amikacinitolerans]
MIDAESPDPELLDLAFPYAMDAVTDGERATIEERVDAADPTTAAAFDDTVRGVRETVAAMTVTDSVAPPAELEAAILSAIDGPAGDGPRRTGTRWLAAAAALVVAVGVGVGAAVFLGREPVPTSPDITAQLVQEQTDTRTRAAAVEGGGTLLVTTSAQLGAATVDFAGVPAPEEGRSYQLWLVPPEGPPRSVGVLAQLPTSDAPFITRFHPSDALAMTIEPPGGSPLPTSTPVATLALG